MEAIDYEKLASVLVDKMVVLNASKDTLWNSEDCARYLRISRRSFIERTSKLPDFPQPKRLQATCGKTNRWLAKDVIKWVNQA